MKKTILAIVLIVIVLVSVYGQNTPVDLILILDTSSQMGSSYEYVNDYLTGSFLREFLRVGDTFHLIPFSGSPRLDVARRISGIGDVETIIGRMLLQYPVESGANVSGALIFTEQYIAALPVRDKKIVLVTLGSTDTAELVSAARQRFPNNVTIDYIQINPGRPLVNVPLSGRAPSTAADSPAPPVVLVPAVPETAYREEVITDAAADIVTYPETVNIRETTEEDTVAAADMAPESEAADAAAAIAADTAAVGAAVDDRVASAFTVTQPSSVPSSSGMVESRSTNAFLPAFSPLLLIILLALLIIALIIFLVTRSKLSSRPNRVMAETALERKSTVPPSSDSHRPNSQKEIAPAYAVSQVRRSPYDDRLDKDKPAEISPAGPLLLNLFVEDQNTSIGKRNIHSLKSGYSFTIGGGRSDDFLIFLVSIPANLGIIRRNGRELTFIPRKAKYFPDIGSKEVKNCINKTIRIVSDKNYEIRFRFEMYEDPLVSLNKIMNSVRVPG